MWGSLSLTPIRTEFWVRLIVICNSHPTQKSILSKVINLIGSLYQYTVTWQWFNIFLRLAQNNLGHKVDNINQHLERQHIHTNIHTTECWYFLPFSFFTITLGPDFKFIVLQWHKPGFLCEFNGSGAGVSHSHLIIALTSNCLETNLILTHFFSILNIDWWVPAQSHILFNSYWQVTDWTRMQSCTWSEIPQLVYIQLRNKFNLQEECKQKISCQQFAI